MGTHLSSLFDVNASFGKPARGGADFPTLRDRLAHMDRLGIGRALVWNVEGCQNHSLSANRKLLDELASTPGARARIIPELVISGLIQYERDGVGELQRQMKVGRTRALRYVNALGKGSLFQLEPVLDALASRRPFLVMRHDEASFSELLEFAAHFPWAPIILTDIIWGNFIKVLDLMRRRDNIMMDTSWLHTIGGMEMVVRHFGAERLAFGTGYRSHNGAAIGALARAEVTAGENRLIAHGNLERLLGGLVPKSGPKPTDGKSDSTFWRRFLAGRPLGAELIDAHYHLGPSAGYVLEDQREECQIGPSLKVMDALGIRTALVSGLQALLGDPLLGNDRLEELLTPYGDRFKGYLTFNPFYADDLVKKIDRHFAGSFYVGFKTLCDYWQVPITDPRFVPMWEYANRHRLPVLIHTWSGNYDAPVMHKDLVRKYPQVSFLLGHSGGSDVGRKQAEELASERGNVFLEWCGSFCSTIPWEETLKKVSPRQVVFGSDAAAHNLYWELGRLLSLNVADTVIAPILGANMRRVLARRR